MRDDILNIRVTNLYMEMMKTTYQLGTCAGACTPCILCLESVCEGLKKKQNERYKFKFKVHYSTFTTIGWSWVKLFELSNTLADSTHSDPEKELVSHPNSKGSVFIEATLFPFIKN